MGPQGILAAALGDEGAHSSDSASSRGFAASSGGDGDGDGRACDAGITTGARRDGPRSALLVMPSDFFRISGLGGCCFTTLSPSAKNLCSCSLNPSFSVRMFLRTKR